MCGITVVANLAHCSSESHAKDAATNGAINGLNAHCDPKKRKLTNGVSNHNGLSTWTVDEVVSNIDSSLDAIKHRGPDSHGTWVSDDGKVGMA